MPKSKNQNLSLKQFQLALEKQLAACSADDLRALLRLEAQAVPASGRQAFLDRLRPPSPTQAAANKTSRQEQLLDDIADFIEELAEAAEENPEWDERYDEWNGHYSDEDSLGPYESYVQPLTALFKQARKAFEAGQFQLARSAYQQLFEAALRQEDDYGRGVRPEDLKEVDLAESRARYLRAVYETESAAQRPTVLETQLQATCGWYAGPAPLLADLIEITAAPLPGQKRFLEDWIAWLRRPPEPGEAVRWGFLRDQWLREAIGRAHGLPGLQALAQAEGRQRPRAYLDWLAALEKRGRHREALGAAQEALTALPEKLPIRAVIADHLCAAAARLKDTAALRAGRWEAFQAAPTLERLLDVRETAASAAEQPGLMRSAAKVIQDYLARGRRRSAPFSWEAWAQDDLDEPLWVDRAVLAHAWVLAGDLDAARQLVAREKVLGWSRSENPQGLVIAIGLVLLSGRTGPSLPLNLSQVWRWGLDNSVGPAAWFSQADDEEQLLERLTGIYVQHLAQPLLDATQQAQWLTWSGEVVRKRVEAIVSNQHRCSYDKAAILASAYAEVLDLRGKARQAEAFVVRIRERFPRHHAFLAELKKARPPLKR